MTDEELKSKKFGLPKLKKYPMPDAAHVRSAIKFFNYVTPANEEELAKAILARMKEYGISPESLNVGDENRFKKYIKDTYLEHHGILGQHWGVRRFQKEDGTRTAAGKKRELENLKDNNSDSSKPARKGLSDTAKSRLKTGAKIAAGLAIAGIAAYGLSQMGNVQNGKAIVDNILSNSAAKASSTTKSIVPTHTITKKAGESIVTKPNSSIVTKAGKSIVTKPNSSIVTKAVTPPPIPKSAAQYVSRSTKTGKPSAVTRSILSANKAAKASLTKPNPTAVKFVYAQQSASMQKSVASISKSTQSTIDFTNALLKQFS